MEVKWAEKGRRMNWMGKGCKGTGKLGGNGEKDAVAVNGSDKCC